MLAGIGFAEDPKLSSDDVAVIKEVLVHFASKTNYFNWSSTDEPPLLVELWSRKSNKAEDNNTNRTDIIFKKASRCPSSLTYSAQQQLKQTGKSLGINSIITHKIPTKKSFQCTEEHIESTC